MSYALLTIKTFVEPSVSLFPFFSQLKIKYCVLHRSKTETTLITESPPGTELSGTVSRPETANLLEIQMIQTACRGMQAICSPPPRYPVFRRGLIKKRSCDSKLFLILQHNQHSNIVFPYIVDVQPIYNFYIRNSVQYGSLLF